MAIAAFKTRTFSTSFELQQFVVSAGGNVTTVIAITYDTATGYTLFWV